MSTAILVMRTPSLKGDVCYEAFEPATDDSHFVYADPAEGNYGLIGTRCDGSKDFAAACQRAHGLIVEAFPEAADGRRVGVRIWARPPEADGLLEELCAAREHVADVTRRIYALACVKRVHTANQTNKGA